jgi:hypothetical protein
MSNTSQTKQGGIGFLGILALIFITLKLMGYIKWSWLWVLAPIWIPFALVGVFADRWPAFARRSHPPAA